MANSDYGRFQLAGICTDICAKHVHHVLNTSGKTSGMPLQVNTCVNGQYWPVLSMTSKSSSDNCALWKFTADLYIIKNNLITLLRKIQLKPGMFDEHTLS